MAAIGLDRQALSETDLPPMDIALLRRRKISFLFLLGVGIPSLVLAYLAFRGIRNELALLEQRRLTEHRAISGLVSDAVDAQIAVAEQTFTAVVAGYEDPADPRLTIALDSAHALKPLVEEAFLFRAPETLRLPAAELLFLADGSRELPGPPRPGLVAGDVQAGQRAEFQRRDYGEALISYRSAFGRTSDPIVQGELLVAIARVERGLGRFEAATRTCETLLHDYGGMNTRSGVPIGPTAEFEYGSLLLAMADSLSALDAFTALYQRLVGGDWELERAQYEFIRRQARGSIDDLLSRLSAAAELGDHRRTLSAITNLENERRKRTERLLAFQESAGEDLHRRVSPGSAEAIDAQNRFVLESGGYTYFVSLLSRTSSPAGAWGLLLNVDYLQDEVLQPALDSLVDLTTTDWLVRRRDGQELLASESPPAGSITVNATFAGNFPPWLMEFYQRPLNPYRRLLASSQSIYFYMFLLIASILVFGLVLTVRAVAQELELARLKSDFVSTVSHEFKSPLTSIRQLAEMLQGGRVPSEERRRRYYDVLVEQSTRLSSLVTNILDLARIEEGRKEFHLEALDLDECLRDIVTTTQHRVGHEGYLVEAQLEGRLPRVRADRDAIMQAISNLIDNAIQYSSGAKRIILHAFASDGLVTVAVQDFGVGIPKDEIVRIFDRFYRGGNLLTRSVKGSGLGLTLVKEVVEAHGGTVHVESEPGRGSTFSIRLPVTTEQNDAKDPDR